MGSYTSNLNLLKKDPTTDGNDTFNIKTMLNDNWDKIDDFCNSSKAKIKMGTYVGTGTSGSDNANMLIFDFAPKLIFIIGQGGYANGGYTHNVRAVLIRNSPNANSFGATAELTPSSSAGRYYNAGLTVSWGTNSVSWYVNNNQNNEISKTLQLNFTNVTYYYVAIG